MTPTRKSSAPPCAHQRPTKPLHVRVMELGDMTFLGLDGRLDRRTAPLLTAQIERALARDSTTIVLDCSLLRSLGRSEVAVLADANEEIRHHHGRFVLRQPNAEARELLDESHLLDEVEIED